LAAALRWRQPFIAFDIGNLVRELVVLNLLSEPARIVTRAQMVCPGPVVHTLGQLHKQNEVLRPQIERPIRSAKVKALAFAELPFSIFASMTLSVAAWLDRRDELPLPGQPVPEQDLAAFGYLLAAGGQKFSNIFAKGFDRRNHIDCKAAWSYAVLHDEKAVLTECGRGGSRLSVAKRKIVVEENSC